LASRRGVRDRPRRLAQKLPILWDGTVLDGELIASRFAGTMAALHGSRRFRDRLRFVVFDVPYLAGADLRPLSWQERRERLELLAQAFERPYELSPVVTPDPSLAQAMIGGELEGLVLKDRTSTYRRLPRGSVGMRGGCGQARAESH
jgi:ATP-dependent DNA ligase